MNIATILKLLRVKHWIKNLFVFIPAFFGARILEMDVVLNSLVAFFCFSLTASGIYIINDIRDVEEDKLHPTKCNRPIASGKVNKKTAITIACFLLVVSSCSALFLQLNLFIVIMIYMLSNILYSFGLKNVFLFDILIISAGFLLRIFGGGVVNDIWISHWLIIMVFLISFFMGLAKRRDDALILKHNNTEVRKNIAKYNIKFIENSMNILAAVILVSYIMYCTTYSSTILSSSKYVYVSSVFVLLGILKYLHRMYTENKSGTPVAVLSTDRFIQITLVCWSLFLFFIIYFQ